MYIPLVLSLSWCVLHPVGSSPVDQTDKSDVPIVGTKDTYIWTMTQLERCFLWSKTLPYQERLDYLLVLQRKILDVRNQRKDAYKNYVPFDETEDPTECDYFVAITIIVGLYLLCRFWYILLD